MPPDHQINDDWRTENRSYGSDLQFKWCKHGPGKQVAEHTKYRAGQKDRRDQVMRSGAFQQDPGNVRHSDADEFISPTCNPERR